MSATIREIVDDALTVIGEASGPGVNTYSDDRMMKDTIRAFNLLHKKYYWDQYLEWFQLPLDGTLGIVTTDAFDKVRDFEDFKSVHLDGQVGQLAKLPKSVNPYTLTGSSLRYWSSLPATNANYSTRRLQFWPKTSTATVNIQARVYPKGPSEAWVWDDIIDMDKDMIVSGVAYMTLSADDLNASAADAQRQLMEMRFKDIKASLSNQPIQVSGGGSQIPDRWFEQ